MSVIPARAFSCSLLLAWLSLACIPSFDEVECYSELDCVQGAACVNGTCVGPDAGALGDGGGVVDAGPTADGGTQDDGGAGSDGGARPDGDVGRDIGLDIGVDAGSETDGGLPGPDATPGDGGSGLDGAVTAVPSSLDFGDVAVDCTAPVRNVSVENQTSATISLSGATLAGGANSPFAVVATSFPLSVAAGGNENVSLTFRPTTASLVSDQLLIGHSSLGSPLFVGLQGRGVLRSETVEDFAQLPGSIDILIVVDDSASMTALQTQLAQQLSQMFGALSSGGWSFQIGVTTTDVTNLGPRGALVGSPAVITNNTPNAEMVLAQRVQVGTSGSGDEQGLEAGYLALSGAAPTSFIRAPAAFLMLYLSDEADHSPRPLAVYYNQINALKNDASRARANSIVGTVLGGCTTTQGSGAQHGIEFITISNNTQGVVSNICGASWTPAITGFPVLPRFEYFTLSGTPDPTTLRVFVNGLELPNTDWSYDAASRRVSFDPANVPPHSASVQIRYSIGC